jgi:monomeric sarcosine oxidase
MMAEAYPLWAELEAKAGEELFVRCGGLLFGAPDHPDIVETRRALAAAGLDYEILPPAAVRERFPALRLEAGEIALFQDKSGFLRSTDCVLANARLAREAGAEIREEAWIQEVFQDGNEVIVETSRGEERFERAIVTAGPWMAQVLADAALPLRVEQRQVVYLDIARNAADFEPDRLPIWIDAGEAFYGFPRDGRIPGVKLASHFLGEPFDPNAIERPVIGANVAVVQEYASRRFPDLSSEVTSASACLYTLTPDENFILDFVPGSPHIVAVSGCSGHGFKFTVLLGKIAAMLAMGEEYFYDLSPWRLRRFLSSA